MQHDIHPEYGPVAFRDVTTGTTFVTGSTLAGRHRPGAPTVEVEGVTYPLIRVETSSASHPFWTGTAQVLDTEGRVEAFNRRYGRTS